MTHWSELHFNLTESLICFYNLKVSLYAECKVTLCIILLFSDKSDVEKHLLLYLTFAVCYLIADVLIS